MLCQICGHDEVEWTGPLTNLSGTKCKHCGGVNCHVVYDEPKEEIDEDIVTDAFDFTELDRDMGLLPKKWKNVVFGSWALIQEIAKERSAKAFVWPDEGKFVGPDFQFNTNHTGYEPLIVDIQTANAMVTIHDALAKAGNRVKMEEWTGKGRGHFASMVEYTWRAIAR